MADPHVSISNRNPTITDAGGRLVVTAPSGRTLDPTNLVPCVSRNADKQIDELLRRALAESWDQVVIPCLVPGDAGDLLVAAYAANRVEANGMVVSLALVDLDEHIAWCDQTGLVGSASLVEHAKITKDWGCAGFFCVTDASATRLMC